MTFTFDQMERMNKGAGQHWFSKDTMRFFKTRLIGAPIRYNMFITSEQYHDAERLYTVRMFIPKQANVVTVGDFNALTKHRADSLMRRVANALDACTDESKEFVLENLSNAEWKDSDLRFYAWVDSKEHEFLLTL